MNILHIGDFHFKAGPKYEFDQILAVDKLIDKVKEYGTIDLVLFTGDLVFSGKNYDDFEQAHNLLFGRLCQELSLSLNNIIVCPGNHDINRDENSEALLFYFNDKINSNNALNEQYNKQSRDFINSYLPSANFNKYHNKYFGASSVESSYLHSISRLEIEEKEIGIISLNSAWLSSGIKDDKGQIRDDKGHLLIPTQLIKESLSKINNIAIKFVLVHHPLYYLSEYNSTEVEDLLYREFNIMFSGHIHKEGIETKYNASNGIYCNTTKATLTFDVNGQIGFTILEYDLDSLCEADSRV